MFSSANVNSPYKRNGELIKLALIINHYADVQTKTTCLRGALGKGRGDLVATCDINRQSLK
jgi:hypothetical protein